jgi:toxin ParE1/3/4
VTVLQVVLTPAAQNDLNEIETYIIEQSGELRAAEVRDRLQKTMHNLALMPGMGRWHPYLDKHWRAFPVAPWTIYYKQRPSDDGIDVLRVIDGRRDLPAVFKKRPRRSGPR